MISDKNKKIISCLRRDARMSLTQMSRKIRIPVSTIFDRLKTSEDNLIVKHTALLNFGKMGFNARANMTIKVGKEYRKELADYLSTHESVNSAYRIMNGYDFLVEGVFKDMHDLESFKESLEERFAIDDTQVYFIVDDIKREEFMAIPELIN